ncbi:MAG: RNA polymerase sigma factor [Planctomycetota bacterium]|jgi:RNA polymerase sigma-70 factor (ECF subfamily)
MTIRENKSVCEDEWLVRFCANGDESALEILYQRYNNAILNFIYRMTSDRTTAEDLTEETFFRVWRKAALFNAKKGTFKTWLFRMASRLTINRLKKQGRRDQLAAQLPMPEQEFEDRSHNPVSAASSAESRRMVHQALRSLNENDRAVLLLRHFKGMGEEEVAQVLKIPKGTVKSRTYYAVRRLKCALEGMGV